MNVSYSANDCCKFRRCGFDGTQSISFLVSVGLSVWSRSVSAPSSKFDDRLPAVQLSKVEGGILGNVQSEAATSKNVDRPTISTGKASSGS